MRVHIGPYRNWFGPHQLAKVLCFWVRDEDFEGFRDKPEWVFKFGEWLAFGKWRGTKDIYKDNKLHFEDEKETWLYKFLLWVDSKKKRKMVVKIDKWDTWSMDVTLAHIILPMLKQLKETKHGSPNSMPAFNQTSNQAQHSFGFYRESDAIADEAGHKQWTEILEKMIWSFEQVIDDKWEEMFVLDSPDRYDYKGAKIYSDRIQEGLELFGKYYRDLWD
jgi:hypothetical protein